MQINAMELTQNGTKLYVCTLTAKELITNHNVKVDYFSAAGNDGYQRKPSSARAKDFARYIKNAKGICPNSVLINIRGEIGNFKPISASFGTLNLPDDTIFWIVDGQHRIEGLRELIEQDSSFASFPCVVILMTANSEYEEAKQFMIINKTQKGVRADLAERFIARMAKREGTKELLNMPKATIRDIEWRPRATDIVDILNNETTDAVNDDFYENPWYKKIQLPNEPRGTTTISQSAFEDSLKILLDNPIFAGYGNKELCVILVRYWNAILELCPAAKIQPDKFVIQRATGAAVLHRILPRVIALATLGGEKISKETIRRVLKNMPDGMNEIFWSTDGVAGVIGTNQKAISILTSRVHEFLETGNADNSKELSKPYEL